MYRWPLALLTGNVHDAAEDSLAPEQTTVELSPRAAIFTLACLAHGGHPTHLALIDAYLGGSIPLRPGGETLGRDSRALATELVSPLVTAYSLGVERLTLANVIVLPFEIGTVVRAGAVMTVASVAAPVAFVDSVLPSTEALSERSLVSVEEPPPVVHAAGWLEVRVHVPSDRQWVEARASGVPAPKIAARARYAASHGARSPGLGTDDWNGAAATAMQRLPPMGVLRRLSLALSARHPTLTEWAVRALIEASASIVDDRAWDSPTASLVRGAIEHGALRSPALEAALEEARASFVQGPGPVYGAAEPADPKLPVDRAGVDAVRRLPEPYEPPKSHESLAESVRELVAGGGAVDSGWIIAEHAGLTIDVALVPDPDGGATLALLPPVEEQPTPDVVKRMEAAARAVLPGLVGVPFAEERKEAIEHRLVGPKRTTTLLVGWSIVLPRNRRVFAAWLGSDGRVLIRLFPPEGQRARGRA